MAPNSNLSALDPCPARNCTYSGVEGQEAVMDSWSGGAYDTTRDRLVVWGGGHEAYAGNEVYVFNINTGVWSLATQPSTVISRDTLYYPDGKPSSRHTYNNLIYAPNIDKFLSVSASALYGNGQSGGNATDAFDFNTNTWARLALVPSSVGYSSSIASVTAYDSVTGHVWYHNTLSGDLSEYNPVNNTWIKHRSDYLPYYSTMAVDTANRKLVALGDANPILVWDLNNPAAAPVTPATSGDKTIESARAPGFVYDLVSKVFVGWSGGSAVYTLNSTTWVWTKVNAAATNTVTPTSAEHRGTYGRFRYIPSKNAFIVVNLTTENVFFYKLSSATPTPLPTVILTATPATVVSGGSSTLTWSSTNATSCAASGAWSGKRGTANAVALSPVATRTYTITCTGAGGSASQSATITVT